MLLTRGSQTYTNDLNGNTLTDGTRTNTWDSQNRLVKCVKGTTTSEFIYGSDGQRRRSTTTTGGVSTPIEYGLDNGMLLREFKHYGNVLSGALTNSATYLVGARGPEYRRDESNPNAVTVRWYLYDGLGSVLGEVAPNGNLTARRKYDVYGAVRSGDSGSSKQKFVGSLGHPSEDETGLIYMRARYYDPVTGRFASEDPALDGRNWFAYCKSDPVNKTDPTGKVWIDDSAYKLILWYISQTGVILSLSERWALLVSKDPIAIAKAIDAIGRRATSNGEADIEVGEAQLEFGRGMANLDSGAGGISALEMNSGKNRVGAGVTKIFAGQALRTIAALILSEGEFGISLAAILSRL